MWRSVSDSWLLLLEKEEEEEAGLGAPKQTEGLCIVLSVTVLQPLKTPGRATFTQCCKPAHTIRLRSFPGPCSFFVVIRRKRQTCASSWIPRSVASRKGTWYESSLCLNAQLHCPDSRGVVRRVREDIYTFNLQLKAEIFRRTVQPCPASITSFWRSQRDASSVRSAARRCGSRSKCLPVDIGSVTPVCKNSSGTPCVLVCSHETGDTRASFGRATVNRGYEGVSSSPFLSCLIN